MELSFKSLIKIDIKFRKKKLNKKLRKNELQTSIDGGLPTTVPEVEAMGT